LDNPKVSIIITTYNREKYLSETIDSIISQTFIDYELIVVDNYSNYDIQVSINNYNDNRIRLYQNNNNGIIAINRNFGIKHARGEFIAFCDDDDIWLPEKLEIQINNIKSFDFCSSDRHCVDENSNIINCKDNITKNNLLFSNHIVLSTVLIKSKILRSGYNFSENLNLLAIEDYELWLRLYLNNYKFSYTNEKLIKYRIHNNGNSKNKKVLYKKIISMFKVFYSQYKISTLKFYLIIVSYKIKMIFR
jgi:teichuronic acid biosynthesis glycosyltransferase TuaG